MKSSAKFWREQSGATAVEYGLIVALMVIVVAAAIPGVGENLKVLFEKVEASFPDQ